MIRPGNKTPLLGVFTLTSRGENWLECSFCCILLLFSIILFVDLLFIRFASNIVVLLEEVLSYRSAGGKSLLISFSSNTHSCGKTFFDAIGAFVSTNLACLQVYCHVPTQGTKGQKKKIYRVTQEGGRQVAMWK